MAAVGASLVSTGDFMMDYQNALNEVASKFPNMKEKMQQTLAMKVAETVYNKHQKK